jgi:hypothetical protein
VRPAGEHGPAGACRSSAASPYHPLVPPIGGSLLDEASSRIHLHSPVRSSPACNPRMGRGPLGLGLRLRTPRLPATHAEVGTGPAHCLGPTLRHPSVSLVASTPLKRPHVASAHSNSSWCREGPRVSLINGLCRTKESRAWPGTPILIPRGGPRPWRSYQLNAGNRCADRPFRRSRATVGAKVIGSIGTQVCVHLSRLHTR